jgi:hypothetical protein
MLPKRLLLGALLMVMSAIITGCATTVESGNDPMVQYRIAKDKCIRFGLRCGTYDYNRCIERILKSGKRDIE